jgi:hypothetical protein
MLHLFVIFFALVFINQEDIEYHTVCGLNLSKLQRCWY